jgi:hypothetical protein
MTMEKNGAISSETPGCCGGGFNPKEASADNQPQQLKLFPETDVEADAMEQDLTKQAVDSVEDASKPK